MFNMHETEMVKDIIKNLRQVFCLKFFIILFNTFFDLIFTYKGGILCLSL